MQAEFHQQRVANYTKNHNAVAELDFPSDPYVLNYCIGIQPCQPNTNIGQLFVHFVFIYFSYFILGDFELSLDSKAMTRASRFPPF